ncbi:MAG TPA: FecR domain-containing protein [Polyangiaceae bacterium]|nr:FecR domain-containing protein [Polyangiaceae bacterium]
MSDEASELRRLLAPLRERPVSVDQERLGARRARVVSSLSRYVRGLAAERASRLRRRTGYAALSLAVAASVAFGVYRLGRRASSEPALAITFVGSVGQTLQRSGGTPRALHTGEALPHEPGEIESAADGSAELVTSAGLGLQLGAATRVSLSGLARVNQVELKQGLLICNVPHMHEGQHFSVETPDARVVVHGTVFSVRVDAKRSHGAQTCVEVTDGVVVVQHDGNLTALNAGDRWGCDSSVGSPVAQHTPLAPAVEPVPLEPVRSEPQPLPRGNARHSERGTLGEERRLFQAALAAERVGQPQLAHSLLEQLLGRYPSSPLAPEARRAATRIAHASAGK